MTSSTTSKKHSARPAVLPGATKSRAPSTQRKIWPNFRMLLVYLINFTSWSVLTFPTSPATTSWLPWCVSSMASPTTKDTAATESKPSQVKTTSPVWRRWSEDAIPAFYQKITRLIPKTVRNHHWKHSDVSPVKVNHRSIYPTSSSSMAEKAS